MYDLHTHSICSDGILRPQAVVSRAKEKGVTTLALTDHDSIDGLGEAALAADELGVNLVTGVEVSCLWSGVGVHVVGLNFDADNSVLTAGLERQQSARARRSEIISERLEKLGISGALEGARRFAGEGSIGRPHFAKYLVEQGEVASVSAAFKRYLGAGKPGDVKQMWPAVAEAVHWIRSAGGTAVLAHPDKYKMTRTKLRCLLRDFCDAGGQAMEVISGCQEPSITRELAQLSEKYQLYASCGSDFHSPEQAWQDLGCMAPLPDDCVPVWESW